MSRRRICLVSPGHLASNPRLVKEADALYEAGFDVRVVAGDSTPAVRPLDTTILARAPWRAERVALGPKQIYLARRLKQEAARRIASVGICNESVAMWAHSPISGRLAKVAAAEPADLYIAHCLAALPAAAVAAQRHGAKLGFDAEDYHVGELDESPQNQLEISVRDRIERMLLPQCEHLTAASPGIAGAYGERYGVRMTPILNVFPLQEAPSQRQSRNSLKAENGLSAYWFSQTIGPNRGLESFVIAMGRMRSSVSLYIRGSDFLGYSESLLHLAKGAGVDERVRFLSTVPPGEMARLAAEYDFGLSLELNTPRSRALCLTNKIFTCLLGGIPMLLSDTPAQRELAAELGQASIVVNSDDPDSIALAVDSWASRPDLLQSAKAEAKRLGRERYNWDVERSRFIEIVETALA